MKGVDNKKLSTAQKLGKVFNDFLEFQDMLAKKIIKATAIQANDDLHNHYIKYTNLIIKKIQEFNVDDRDNEIKFLEQ